MSDLIAFDIYRTEFLRIAEQKLHSLLHKKKDDTEYALIATNENNQKQTRAVYSNEVADDFRKITGSNLAEAVYKILINDIYLAKAPLKI